MFDHFTFGAPAQSHYPQQEERETSPTDCSHPSLACDIEPTTVWEKTSHLDGLLNQFAQSSIRPEEPMWNASLQSDTLIVDENELPQQSIWSDSHLLSPDFDDSEFSIEELSYVSTRRGMAKVPLQQAKSFATTNSDTENLRHESVACRRLRRQKDAKRLSCEKHVRDISALVVDMIDSNSQCNLRASTSSTKSQPSPTITQPPALTEEDIIVDVTQYFPSTPLEVDEGFGEMEEDPLVLDFERERLEIGGKDDEMTLRRASTPSGIRKYTVAKYRKSGDIGNAVTANGRPKVRSVPRMRRRKIVSAV